MQSLWRAPWLRGLLALILLFVLRRAADPDMTIGVELTVLSVALTLASAWGLFHTRRVLAQRHTALRDALLTSVLTFLFFREIIGLARIHNTATFFEIPLLGSVFLPLVSGTLSLALFPILAAFNLNLVALAGMVSRSDRGAESTILPVFGPTVVGALLLDLLTTQREFYPIFTLASPLWALVIVLTLRSKGLDFAGLSQRLTHLLDRKCTRRSGRGPRDFRGIVLGGTAGLATLILLSPTMHFLIAPFEATTYNTATQLGNHLLSLRIYAERDSGLSKTNLAPLLPKYPTKLEALQKMVVLTYDDTTRYQVLKSSEAHLQAQLLNALAPTRPAAIVLSIPTDMKKPPVDVIARTLVTPSAPSQRKNSDDFPELIKSIQAAGVVCIVQGPRDGDDEESSAAGKDTASLHEALHKSAHKLASAELTSSGSTEIPAIDLTSALPPVALALVAGKSPRPTESGPFVIDFRQDLQQVRLPLPMSQLLQKQFLYDTKSQRWVGAKEFFAGKYVFIEPLNPPQRSTPLGMRSEMEVHAQATATLLQKQKLARPSPALVGLLTVFLAALIGHMCVGRAPLEALWRISFPLILVGVTGIGVSVLTSLQANPILPILGGVFSFLTVTQFTFAVERDQRARNRELLGRFVAPQAIEQILEDPEGKLGLGGKRRRVVVLFVDVRGFSSFAEQRTPEAVVTTMNRYLAIMTDVLNFHEGILDKYTGDGLMALFLVEEASEAIDVLRAVEAAQDMAMEVQNLAQTMQSEGGDALAVGMGLHYGEAVVGMVGHPTRQINFTALGHTVVVAARLQTLASGGEIILSESVYKVLPEGSISSEAGESVTVKGVAEPVPIYRIKTNRAERGSLRG